MDNIDELLREIAKMPELNYLEEKASSFLNDVGEIFERHGAGVARAYLLNQGSRRNKHESDLLLMIIEKFRMCPEIRSNRAVGRQIIKCLFELKKGVKR